MLYNAHQVPRLANLVRAAFGEEAARETISPELVFAVIIANDRPEHQLHQRIRLWSIRFVFAAGGAGNFNTVQLNPDLGSNVISVVTHLFSDQLSFFGIQPNPAALGNGIRPVLRDVRGWAGTAAPYVGSGVITNTFNRQGVQTAPATPNGQFLPANLFLRIPDIIVKPGAATNPNFFIESQVANIGQNMMIYGYEYDAKPEELSL